MSLILDRILRGYPVIPPSWVQQSGPEFVAGSEQTLAKLRADVMPDAQVIEASNVADLWWSHDNDNWDLRTDFPTLVPPFPVTWFEMRRPSRVRVAGNLLPSDALPAATGVLVSAQKFEADDGSEGDLVTRLSAVSESMWRRHGAAVTEKQARGAQLGLEPAAALRELSEDERTALELRSALASGDPMALRAAGARVPHGRARWSLNVTGFIEVDGRIYGPLVSVRFAVDDAGAFIDGSLKIGAHASAGSPDIHQAAVMLKPAYLAMSFLHCKNVRVVPRDPPERLSRKHQKRHGRPLLRYHVLEIDPMKEILRVEGQSAATGLKQALHVCRGHFKDYRQKGLFGKYRGLYWWDAHARGSSDAGVVAKDYSIQPSQS